MDRWIAFAALLFIGALLTGCLDSTPGALDPTKSSLNGSRTGRPTVVAILDSGVNPYHQAFAARVPELDAANFSLAPSNVSVIHLSQAGDWKDRIKADEPMWKEVKTGQLYAFAGTRVLGISFGNDLAFASPGIIFDNPSYAHIKDENGHGTRTAGLVAREDPDAILVMVQVNGNPCNPGNGCLVDTSMAAAMEWAAAQPWIDIISASLGIPTNPPTNENLGPEGVRYLAASRAASLAGKLVVDSAGNYVGPTVPSYFSGPPWVIAVGGFEPGQQGERPEASKLIDVVANYSEYAPEYQDMTTFSWATGTSFACPTVAGVLSRALHQVRTDLRSPASTPGGFPVSDSEGAKPSVTARMFRDALNESAEYVSTTNWDPSKPTTNDTSPFRIGGSLPVVVQPAQMGWGYVSGKIVPKIVERVEASARGTALGLSHDAIAQAYQAQFQDARERYWSSALS